MKTTKIKQLILLSIKYTIPCYFAWLLMYISFMGYKILWNSVLLFLLPFIFIWPIFLAYASLGVGIVHRKMKKGESPLKKGIFLFFLFHTAVLLQIIIFIFLVFPGHHYRINGIQKEFGPTISELTVSELDRNKNGIADTLKISYTTTSDVGLYTFGGVNVCLGSNLLEYVCKNVHFNLVPRNGHLEESDFRNSINKGDTRFTTYLFLDKPLPALGNDQYLEFDAIGADASIMYRKVKIIPPIKTEEIEVLPFGSWDESYPDYIRLDKPLE